MKLLSTIAFFKIANIDITVNSDVNFEKIKYSEQLLKFKIQKAESNSIYINHHFLERPEINFGLVNPVYSKEPWEIYKSKENWIYASISVHNDKKTFDQIILSDYQYTNNHYYHFSNYMFGENVNSITFTPTDQILLAQVLSFKSGFFLHAGGVILDTQGFLFVGHSGDGKTTLLKMLQPYCEILCDDRIIVRYDAVAGFQIHGTWNSGELPDVSQSSSRLNAIFFLEKSNSNRITKISPNEVAAKLPFYIVKPFITKDWWQRTFDLLEKVCQVVPCYKLEFDRSGEVLPLLLEKNFG